IAFRLNEIFASTFHVNSFRSTAFSLPVISNPWLVTLPEFTHMVLNPLLEGIVIFCSKPSVFLWYISTVNCALLFQKARSSPRLYWSVTSHFKSGFKAPRQ